MILEGTDHPSSTDAPYSTVHGAGRVMSRTQARGKMRRRKRWVCGERSCRRVLKTAQPNSHPKRGACSSHPDAKPRKVCYEEQVRPGLVDFDAVKQRMAAQGIELRGAGADEAPEVYKRLPQVLAAHGGQIRVKHRLRPVGVAMAGADVHDPFKD